MNKILIVVAHPDDEVLGCGGSIIKHINNDDEVYITFATYGYIPEKDKNLQKIKKEHAIKSCEILGVKKENIKFLGYEGAKLDKVNKADFNKHITDIVSQIEPDIIYTHHWGDLNFDHKIVFEAVIVASRPHDYEHKKIRKVYCCEILSSSEWSGTIGENFFIPTVYNVLNKDIIDKKIKAFKVYKTEQCKFPHPRSPEQIYNLSVFRGGNINENFAEAFVLVREIIK